jgi:hypothetical protein
MFIAKVSKNVCIFVLIRYPHWPSPHDYKLNYTKPVTMMMLIKVMMGGLSHLKK